MMFADPGVDGAENATAVAEEDLQHPVVDAVARHRQQNIEPPVAIQIAHRQRVGPLRQRRRHPEREGPVAAAGVDLQDGGAGAPIGQRHQQIDAAVPVHVGRQKMACFGVGIPRAGRRRGRKVSAAVAEEHPHRPQLVLVQRDDVLMTVAVDIPGDGQEGRSRQLEARTAVEEDAAVFLDDVRAIVVVQIGKRHGAPGIVGRRELLQAVHETRRDQHGGVHQDAGGAAEFVGGGEIRETVAIEVGGRDRPAS